MQSSPLVIHGHGTLGNAQYVSTSLRRVAHLCGGNEAHDSAAHQIGALHCKRCHARKEFQRGLVARCEYRHIGGYFATTACVDQLQNAQHFIADAQWGNQHAARLVPGLDVNLWEEVIRKRSIKVLNIINAQ